MTWKQALDRAHSLAQLDAVDPASVLADLEADTPAARSIPELEERDAFLTAALDAFDTLAVRAMKVRLEHALVADGSFGPPTRNVFAQTLVSYADNVGLLAERARDIAARGRSPSPDHVADLVAGAARATLDQRAALRDGVLDLVRRLAKASTTDADKQARDGTLDETIRKRWSAVRRDLETLAVQPAAISAAPMAKRVAAWPDQLEEPTPVREATLAELIEID
ncbi:MAG: hypothetical protein ACKV2T_03940 [Kofleriaceae bacterium]